MAKEDKAKLRFVFVELEGSNEALTNAIRDVGKALTRPGSGPRQLPGGIQAAGAIGPAADENVEDAEFEEVDETPATPKPKSTPKPRKPPKLKVVPLDLEKGTPTFREFIELKGPSDHTNRYLCIMYWLKENLGITQVDTHHIYTCYRVLSAGFPTDWGQVFRDMAKQDRGYVDSAGNGKYELNVVGEDRVNKMTPAPES